MFIPFVHLVQLQRTQTQSITRDAPCRTHQYPPRAPLYNFTHYFSIRSRDNRKFRRKNKQTDDYLLPVMMVAL